MEPHIIFLDLDGTLCVPQQPPSILTFKAINQARKNGHKVFLCTGRALSMLPDEVRELEWDGMITGLGAHIIIDGETVWEQPYSLEEIQELRDYFDSVGIVYLLEGSDEAFMSLSRYKALGIKQMTGINQEVADLEAVVEQGKIIDISFYQGQPVFNIAFLSMDDERLASIHSHLGNKYRIVMHPAIEKEFITDLELIRRTVNKGEALKFVCDACRIPLEHSIAFGDSMNDYDMIVRAGLGVAMDNGDDEIKSYADFICKSVEEDGLYHMFRELNLL
ncbi:MAG: HAD family hydrolase [Lachnospiraceae bacterium]|nr:HAD family hydrolase [Lachnospiraceae bacterium]